MRPEICSRRNRAAIVAAEEEEAAPAPSGLFGRNTIFAAIAGSKAPMTAEMAAQPVHFDPVPIFVGPKPGWAGPVLTARPLEKAPAGGTPSIASAYAADKPAAVERAAPESAPVALQSAVRPIKPAKAAAAVKTAAHAKLAAAKQKDRHAPAAAAH
jgi:hypothetical protein